MSKAIIDLSRDGYFRITPEMRQASEIEFHARTGELSLQELQKGVGGYIERLVIAQEGMDRVDGGPFGVQLQPRGTIADLWFNEEGKLQELELNPLATAVAHVLGGLVDWDCIVGTALVTCGKAREQPEAQT